MNKFALTIGLSVAAGVVASPIQAAETHNAFFEALSALCGGKYQGQVVESNESDAKWRDSVIIMNVAECSDETIRIPLSVGEDTSRTWIITLGEGLTLKHDHRHQDGTPDQVTMYGGEANETIVSIAGALFIREFPADAYSKALFLENGLDESVNNTWVLKIMPGKTFSYRLQRPGRTFQIDFDLAKPLDY